MAGENIDWGCCAPPNPPPPARAAKGDPPPAFADPDARPVAGANIDVELGAIPKGDKDVIPVGAPLLGNIPCDCESP